MPELNRLLEDALVREAAWDAVSRLDPQHLSQYDLDFSDIAVLETPDPGKLAAFGVHPMLAMWGSFMRNPDFSAGMSAGEYFVDQGKDAS
ncbi:hypothetical protein CFH99_00805 [Nocardioides aromaticivorans]|uniref:Uncharacterized protein n=1 Tax=Nocardioides aromaticivorans TaxID=200618 RepID=A0ABX7PEC3_9ACTN|nr:hypothetical protein CFH99_00805 [Nocardioides aromaticivorans]